MERGGPGPWMKVRNKFGRKSADDDARERDETGESTAVVAR
jgi:hypothetical protein